MPGEEAFQKARAAALKSLSLDNSFAEAHAAYGLIRTLEGDYAAAEGDFKRAIALRPDSAVAQRAETTLRSGVTREIPAKLITPIVMLPGFKG